MWLNKEASKKYQFDFCDITTLITIVAIILTFTHNPISTLLFIIGCALNIIYTIVKLKRFNLLVLHIGLLIFNLGFMFGWC